MRYIIQREWPTGETRYIHDDWPYIKWTDEKLLALRMHPERAAKAAYHLMLQGVSFSIIQHIEI